MKKNKNPIFGIALAVALGLSTIFIYQNVLDVQPESPILEQASQTATEPTKLNGFKPASGDIQNDDTAPEEDITGDMNAEPEVEPIENNPNTENDTALEESSDDGSALDRLAEMEKNPLMSIRAIGAVDAPVVIEEFSSFTCPHCAAFHEGTLKDLKERYIDTGQVRLVFRDYPLNAPSLQAAGLARCMPEDQYYDFITVLFETQEEWAQSGSPDKLMQTAKLAGLTDESLKACAGNDDLIKFILRKMQVLGKEYDIKSTPTFVFNGGEASLRGNRDIGEFSAIINELLVNAE